MNATNQAELDRLHRGLLSMWAVWMQWFTWFFGANVVLLWIQADKPAPSWPVVLFWLFFNISGISTAVMFARYNLSVKERADLVLDIGEKFGFPCRLGFIGALFNGLALVANCAMWVYLRIRAN